MLLRVRPGINDGKRASEDLRLRVLKAADEGVSARQVAARFGIEVSSVIRWIARSKIGEQQERRRGSRLDQYAGFIVGMIEVCPDITLNEMMACL